MSVAPRLDWDPVEWAPSPWWVGSASPRRGDAPPRGTGHTTETRPGTAEAVRKNLRFPYHFLVELKARRILQLVSMNRTAGSLKAGPGSHETNHAGSVHIQYSIVDYSRNMPGLGNGDLQFLADFIGRVNEETGIPNLFAPAYGPNMGIIIASTRSPVRWTWNEWYKFSGWGSHQLVPGQDHWDQGALDVVKLSLMIKELSMLPLEEWFKYLRKAEKSGQYHPAVELWQRLLKAASEAPGASTKMKSVGQAVVFSGKVDIPTKALNELWEANRFPNAKKPNAWPWTKAWPILLAENIATAAKPTPEYSEVKSRVLTSVAATEQAMANIKKILP